MLEGNALHVRTAGSGARLSRSPSLLAMSTYPYRQTRQTHTQSGPFRSALHPPEQSGPFRSAPSGRISLIHLPAAPNPPLIERSHLPLNASITGGARLFALP